MTWIKDIVIFSAVMGFIKWIIPSGTFEKYINYIISLLTLAVIMTPLLSQTTAAVYLELPVGAVAGEEETRSNSQSNSIETIQTYQIQELIIQKVKSEICSILKDKFSGITEEDITVYIEHEPLKYGGTKTCLIVIEIEEMDRSKEISSLMEDRLDLEGVVISIKEKKGETKE